MSKALIGLLILLTAAAVLLLAWAIAEPHLLDTDYFKLGPQGRRQRLRLAAAKARPVQPASRGLRLAFFSDTHARFLFIPVSRLLKDITAAGVDAVAFGGDFSSSEHDLSKAMRYMRELAAGLTQAGIPLLGVMGNHDEHLSRETAEQTGLLLLANESVMLPDAEGQPWLITGLQDLRLGRADLTTALATWHGKAASLLTPSQQQIADGQPLRLLTKPAQIPPARRIVLAHNPDTILSLPEGAFSWVLSGHFHGGQIRMPFRLEYKVLRHDRLCKQGYDQGPYSWHDAGLFISRGLGCVLLPFRFLARPELSILTFEPEA
ncbi:MAG: metallophosphoesterase [Oscillospiraceae bacterium]|nr:metallophosphoesterase [Oscillospiraceae bacterium]MDD4368129.1 metallophosphoesterase [Oscillospiraceae bacterium]